MLPIQTTHLRPRTFVFIIPLVFCIALLVILGTQKNLPPQVQYIFLIPFAILALIWLGYRKILVTLDNEGLTYKGMFSTKQVLWIQVQKTYIKYQSHGKSGNHYWFFELPDKRVKISTGLYSRKSLQIISEAVVEKCKKAEIEDRIFQMAKGRFAWYIF